jgi:hypothetical protein
MRFCGHAPKEQGFEVRQRQAEFTQFRLTVRDAPFYQL